MIPTNSLLPPSAGDLALLKAAKLALRHAHAPYSKFRVGAALRARDGRIFSGCNVENASYGLTICAERVALFSAIAAGARRFESIAIVAEGIPPLPCGACRQTLAEFFRPTDSLWVATSTDLRRAKGYTLNELLPHPFQFKS
ncbi:MAG: cytidine deaminase [Kiritimatiellia bacterium]|nr:cytidine deaminase [Kiritimatiellia bacterium]